MVLELDLVDGVIGKKWNRMKSIWIGLEKNRKKMVIMLILVDWIRVCLFSGEKKQK